MHGYDPMLSITDTCFFRTTLSLLENVHTIDIIGYMKESGKCA